ncbi:MAG: lamin tail domain-containing protein [Sedimentisphaerales bacterium]|nr:lamin tail domain-containing protein [Sedimentisphaerales bacterium]
MLGTVRVHALFVSLFTLFLVGTAVGACPEGDLDDNCRVDFNDVKFLADRWLDPAGSAADLVGNDGVDWADFAKLAQSWHEEGTQTGSLRVSLYPEEIIAEGGQWRIDGGELRDSGETVELAAGGYTVSYVDVPGWTKPADEVVSVSVGGLTTTSGTYVRLTGSLRVNILPASAASAGGRWRVDGGAWHSSGETATGVFAGGHIVEFEDIDGWVSATDRSVIVSEAALTEITGTYSQPLVISEFLTSNHSPNPPVQPGQLVDEDGDSSDWIEIYNPTDMTISLDGWYLTNSDANLAKWQFPTGVDLNAGDFLVVFASGKDRRNPAGPLHTNFDLGMDPDYLALVGSDGISVVYEYYPEYPDQLWDISYGVAQNATALVGEGASVKYHVPTSGDATANWTAISYNDLGWSNGATSIGFGDIRIASGVKYEYYEGSWNYLPNFDTLTPVKEGVLDNFDFSPREQVDYFAFRYRSSIEIPTGGTYTFYTSSDDGSQLFIGSTLVVDNDGLHGMQEASGSIYLTAGMHPITVTFFEGAVDDGLIVSYEGPGISKREIPDNVLWIGPTTNIETAMRNVNASLWVRASFDLEAGQASTFDTLNLRMKYEDGYVAYLNGTPVAYKNNPMSLSWNSTALTDRPIEEAMSYESVNLMPYIGSLVVGKNVLAIQALNDTASNGEFVILPELIYTSDVDMHQYFETPTPGTYNVSGSTGAVGEVWFSHERGFYSSSFTLILSTETNGAEIRYTTDGTTPTATHGSIYTPGVTVLTISGTTPLRAVAVKPGYVNSEVASHTFFFVSDVKNQTGWPGPGWPTGSVNGQVMEYGMSTGITQDPTWGPQMEASLLGIPSLSITTDFENLFDPAIGIYVNPYGEGRDWERPASVELINPDGSDGFHIDAGLRIRGGYSRGTWNPKHAFRLFFRSEYGEANLNFPLFEDEGVSKFDKVDVRTSQNYSWSHGNDPQNTMVREVFSRDIQGAMGHPYTRSRYYHLYLNGVYWGLFQTQERAESVHAASYMGGDRDDYDVVKTPGMFASDGTRASLDRFYNTVVSGGKLLLDDLELYYRVQGLNMDGTPNPAYERMFDVDNVIDFMIIEYYTGDRDGPASRYTGVPNNTYGAYNRVNPDGWKWYHHDNEHTLGAGAAELNMVEPFTTAGSAMSAFNPHWLHQECANINIDYRTRFTDHVYKAFYNGGLLTVDKAREYIQMRASQIDMAIIAESARWGGGYTKQTWLNEIDWLLYNTSDKRTITDRVPTVIQQFRNVGWYPYLDPPSFSIPGGDVPSGQTVTLSSPVGTIYYTTDGSDPRLPAAQSGGGGTVVLVAENAAKRVKVPTGPVTSTTGSILYEYWLGIGSGNFVWDLTNQPDYPDNPSGSMDFTSFEAPVDWANEYGAKISGYVHPPSTGNYRFWISSDDNSELWLSSDENPANASLIAYEDSWSGSRIWEDGNERSAYIFLQGGHKYYIEALMKEGTGGDNFAATWSGPGVTFGQPISGAYLSPPAFPDSWTRVNYDHSTWASYPAGNTGVGYENNPGDPVNYSDLVDIDVGSQMDGINETCYIRIPFTIGVLDFSALTLKIRYDDGFVAYINGSRVASRNFPTGEVPEWNSGADDSHSDSLAREFEVIAINEHIGKLQVGENVLAIQGLNYGTGSSDFLISAELTASMTGQGDPVGQEYMGPITIDKSTVVKARVFDTGWSPLREETYSVGQVKESLRITELMYHPYDSNNPEDPNEEYIELQNIGGDPINLNLVKFTNGVDFTFGDITLDQNDYVVVVAKQSAFEAQYPSFSGVIAGEYSGRLDNGGERIELVDAIGRSIHNFRYQDGWRSITDGDGYSLTIIDPTEVLPEAPEVGLESHWCFDGSAMDSVGTNNGTLYGGAGWASGKVGDALSLDGSGDYVGASATDALKGSSVTVSMWIRVTGLTGYWNPVLTQHDATGDGYYFYVFNNKPAFSVMTGGATSLAGSPETIGLNEWCHVAGTNDGSTIRLYVNGESKGSATSTGRTGADYDLYVGYDGYSDYFSGLVDDVRVYDRALSPHEFEGQGGTEDRWNDKDSWRASVYFAGSPGWDDSGIIPNPGAIVINEVLSHSHSIASDWIELYNTTDLPINIGGWHLSDSGSDLKKYKIAAGTTIGAYDYVVFREDSNFGEPSSDPGRITPFALSEDGEQVILSSAEGEMVTGYRAVEDFGASLTGISFGRYFKRSTGNYNFVSMHHVTPLEANAYPLVGPIVITEIMYNPASGDQKEEFIELHNINPTAITLYDSNEGLPWKFSDGVDFEFPGYPGLTLGADKRLVVAKDVTAYLAKYGPPPTGVLLLGPFGGKLSNSGEQVQLVRPGDLDEFGRRHWIRVDRVSYSDGSHPGGEPGDIDLWPTEPDGGGASLSRDSDELYGNDPNNWSAAIPPTPGA